MLPTSFPVTSITLNYAGVAVAIVLLGAVTMWTLPYVGARHWYRGELKTYIPEPEPVRMQPLLNPPATCTCSACRQTPLLSRRMWSYLAHVISAHIKAKAGGRLQA